MLSRSFAGFVDFVNCLSGGLIGANPDINQALASEKGESHEPCYADRSTAYIKLTLMSRRMSPEREQELEELLAFLEFHEEHLRKKPSGPPPEFTLRATVERIAGEYGRSKALEGTRQAVNDVLEELADLAPESVKVADEALVAAGLVTLSALRRRYAASYRRVLKRGSIKTETEYYLVNGLVVDQASGISADEREKLQAMVSAYEG